MKLHEVFRKRITYEVLFSLYLSTVVISAEEMRDFSWSTSLRLLVFSHFRPRAQKPIDNPHAERLIAFFLAWLLAILIFLCLRFVAKYSIRRLPLETAAGFVAFGGLSAALLYSGMGNRVLLAAQVALGALCAFLYVYRMWPASWRLNLAFILLYFGFSTWEAWHSWITFPLGFFLLWPGFDWILGTYPQTKNIYPLLGFIFSMSWGIYVRDNAAASESLNVSQ